jgi:hypothetical protein
MVASEKEEWNADDADDADCADQYNALLLICVHLRDLRHLRSEFNLCSSMCICG